MSNKNDFASLLSVFRDATTTSSSSRSANLNNGPSAAAVKSSGGGEQKRQPSAASLPSSVGTPTPSPKDSIDHTSTKDPSFSPSLLKERIERILRIQQIRRSTASSGVNAKEESSKNDERTKREVRIAICSTIVDDFPHEALWRKWIEETGGEFTVDENDTNANSNAAADGKKSHEDVKEGKCDSKGEGSVELKPMKFTATAELYIHAKNPERVGSEWLRSKTLPITHRPNWNDVRIIRAMLSLIKAALKDERATHILLCTESCIPVATLKECAKSVLLDEICHWEEKMEGGKSNGCKGETQHKNKLDWDRSFVDCYGRGSSRCTRFDEHNCWDILKDSVPGGTIYKALPGWCFLSRKHAQRILDIPSQLEGLNLWPAFERVWAPEEVYIPTALALCGHMDDGTVSRRALTHSQWDERAANHKDRAHPLPYDGCFDHQLVSRVRRDGCLFLRKMKLPLNLSLWDQIVVQRQKGCQDATGSRNPEEQDWRRGRDREMERGHGHGRYRDDGGRNNRSYNSRTERDARRSYDDGDNRHRHDRGRGDHSSYGSPRKRQRWRR